MLGHTDSLENVSDCFIFQIEEKKSENQPDLSMIRKYFFSFECLSIYTVRILMIRKCLRSKGEWGGGKKGRERETDFSVA